MHRFFALSIIKNLYPEYYFFTDSIRETFIKIIFLFHNKIFQGYFFEEKRQDYKILVTKFILNSIGNCLIIFGFLIYLEIIELNFYGFNYNLRNNIIQRSMKDIQEIIDDDEEQNEFLINNNSNKSSELSIKAVKN